MHTHTHRKLEEKWVELTTGIISVPKWLAGQGMFWFVATRLTGQRHTQLIKLPLVFRTHKPVELCNINVHFTTPQPYGKATTITSQHPNPMEKQQPLLHNTPTLWKSNNCYFTTPQPYGKATTITSQHPNPMEKQQLLLHNTPTLWKSNNCYFTTPQPYGKATTVTSQHPNPMEKQQLLLHNTATLSKRENHSIMPQQKTIINVTLSTLLLTTLTSGVFLSVCMAINFISPTFSGTHKKQTQNYATKFIWKVVIIFKPSRNNFFTALKDSWLNWKIHKLLLSNTKKV